MESWERMAGWIRRVYSEDLLKQSGQVAEGRLPRAEHAWRQFCLIPTDFLRTSTGKTDPEAFRRMSAFLMYHWEAGSMAGLSLSTALCGLYNAGFTLLRSYLELIFRGVLSQCLTQSNFRDTPSRVLKPTNTLVVLTKNLSTAIRERQIDKNDLERNTILIFSVLHGHWIQDILRLDLGSIVRQVADWGMLRGLKETPGQTIGDLYAELSRNAHERVEYTDSGRAVEEAAELFEWPAPILKHSLEEFLTDFHLAMEIGVIAVLNQVSRQVTGSRFKEMCQRLLENESFRNAEMRRATKLVNRWAS